MSAGITKSHRCTGKTISLINAGSNLKHHFVINAGATIRRVAKYCHPPALNRLHQLGLTFISLDQEVTLQND